jgi:D-alanyl-D-alanine carboxypeptidase/D-alanyl-D-alanine-endopeptidase (penicillin-binding protein 4)
MKLTDVRSLAGVIAALVLLFLTFRADFINLQFAAPLQTTAVREQRESKKPGEGTAGRKLSGSELSQLIDQQIDRSEFAAARWGISVISLSNGTTLYERNADKLFTPASNMKIYTTGVALDLLGVDYRWRTSVYTNSQPDADGTVRGDLILYGRGAPDLVSRSKDNKAGSLSRLADDLYGRGIRNVKGNVVGDESYFRGNLLGDGWQWTDIQWYFGAEASALSVDGNEIDVNVVPSSKSESPPEVRVNDPAGYVTIDNRMAAGTRTTRSTIGLYRGLSDNNVQAWGEFAPGSKGFGARLSVHNPALWTARLFLAALQQRGISVEGQAYARNARVAPSQRFDPAQAVELVYTTSQPLSEIARITNKESNNLYAELILRTLGRERGAMLQEPEAPGRERGDDESGVAVIRLWLVRAGVATEHLALHDGSGLSRLNLVTPHSTARLLASLSKTASGPVFKQSLPISGRDGTLAGRLKTVVDRVLAKTGSLTYDNSLSGYLSTADGETFVFSILCNDHSARGNSVRLIDRITTLLAAYPHLDGEKSQKVQ